MRPLSNYLLYILISTLSVMAQNTVGLIQTSEAAFPGYTLFTPNTSTATYLIDNEGRLIHQWNSDYIPTLSVYLLEDGSLLRSAALTSGSSSLTGGFQKFSWEGELLWEYYLGPQHHDIEPLPNGNVLVIVNDAKNAAAAIAAGRDPALIDGPNIRSLALREIRQTGVDTGEVVWEWKAWDHLIQDFDSTKANYGVVADHPELININFARDGAVSWIHTNSIDYHPVLDQIVISNRGISELWIIDHSTSTEEAASHAGGSYQRGGDLLYRWGNPASYAAGDSSDQRLFAQHDARWIEVGSLGAGNLTIFNNGEDRPDAEYSSVDEIVLPVDENGFYSLSPGEAYAPESASWSYIAEVPTSFAADRFGGAHRLPNGNTLICSPLEGRFFEVNSQLETVWAYINPVGDNGILEQGSVPELNTVYRAERYALDFPGFSGRDLTPGLPIEATSGLSQAPQQRPETLRLYPNLPNPFNASTTLRYELNQAGPVTLLIHDLQGRILWSQVIPWQTAGLHSLPWDGRNADKRPLPSGIYILRLQSGAFQAVQKLNLLK